MAKQLPFSITTQMESFLLGLSIDTATQDKKELEDQLAGSKIVEKIEKDMRTYYDRYVPNIYIGNVYKIANIIVNNIAKFPEKFIKIEYDYNNPIDDKDLPALAKNIVSTTLSEGSRGYLLLVAAIRYELKKYHKSVLNKSNPNPIVTLNTLSLSLFSRLRSQVIDKQTAILLGIKFSSKIKEVFGNRANLGVYAPELGSNDNTFIFFSSSFVTIRDPINQRLSKAVLRALSRILLKEKTASALVAKTDIKVGGVVNFGHSLVQTELGSYINSPGFAQAIYGVAQGRSSVFSKSQLSGAAALFKKESRLVETKITLDKNFTSSEYAGALMVLGITITQPEDWKENQLRGTKYEASAVSKMSLTALKSKSKYDLDNLRRWVINAASKAKLFGASIASGNSSNNLYQYLEKSLSGVLGGKAPKVEKAKLKKQKTTKITVLTPTGKKPLQFKQNKPTVSVEKNNIRSTVTTLPSSTVGLSMLLQQINSNLQDQIKRNMGTGSSKTVLNYRTGRFAESVKVERLSESRQGMITAFYSYMKNPYATFSQGGRQQYPRSRDPKTLISKSIREIAQTMVTNQLRAVNV